MVGWISVQPVTIAAAILKMAAARKNCITANLPRQQPRCRQHGQDASDGVTRQGWSEAVLADQEGGNAVAGRRACICAEPDREVGRGNLRHAQDANDRSRRGTAWPVTA